MHNLAATAILIFSLAISSCSGTGDTDSGDIGGTGDDYASYDGALSGDSWPQAKARGSGTLTAVYVPAPGFAYHDDEGHLSGVTVELMRAFAGYVADYHNVELTLDFVREEDWRTFYSDIVDADDGVIGMGNVTITEERREELAFSPPYMTNIASLITHRDAPTLTRLKDLESVLGGRSALAFEGTLHEERLRTLTSRYYPDARFRMAGSNDEIIELVGSGDRYFAYIDLYNYWRAVDQGAALQRHTSGDEAAEQFGYIMPLNTTWQPVISEFFEHNGGIVSTRLYREIMETHLGTRLAATLLEAHSGTDH
ncbi:transporter substrate-binding domain-containing protein [Balneolales bacterium ANBcel1]|nr:transporter substrate-binding domain-containing protein [Balneolales bacterium ANBcel1]